LSSSPIKTFPVGAGGVGEIEFSSLLGEIILVVETFLRGRVIIVFSGMSYKFDKQIAKR